MRKLTALGACILGAGALAACTTTDPYTGQVVRNNTGTGAIAGFEVLLRWIDRAGAVHAPGTFLPLATELGITKVEANRLRFMFWSFQYGQNELQVGLDQSGNVTRHLVARSACEVGQSPPLALRCKPESMEPNVSLLPSPWFPWGRAHD